MSKSNLLTSILKRISQGETVISELENKQIAAKRGLAAANSALQEATVRYEAALGEGREAAIAARQQQTVAEVDLDIARRTVDVLAQQVAEAHEAVRLAGIEHKQAEAERLRSVFEETARQQLAQMSVGVRAIIRAWAEAELAIEGANQAQDLGSPVIPPAENCRNVGRIPRKEVSRTRITRWLRSGQEPYGDEINRTILSMGRVGWLPNDRMSGGGHEVREKAEFDRVTYIKSQAPVYTPSLIESLSVPAFNGCDAPGWSPVGHMDPRTALARLADLEHASPLREVERETIDEFVALVGAGLPGKQERRKGADDEFPSLANG